MEETSGIVFDIERFSTHDGPGIRTVVFLKGCPLRCQWCASPESQERAPQMGFLQNQCVGCERCVRNCPQGEYFHRNHMPDFQKCVRCFHCAEDCLPGARVIYGKRLSAGEVVAKAAEDLPFYLSSGGGVTLTGGEVSAQPDFASEILSRCHEKGIHTAIETCGFAPWESFEKVIRFTDCLMFDLKCMDSAVHKRYTGVGNESILANAAAASRLVGEMIIRVPVIPGVNDSPDNFLRMAEFVTGKLRGVKQVDLLPYHSMGASKAANIGRRYPFEAPYEIDDARLRTLSGILTEAGLSVRVVR